MIYFKQHPSILYSNIQYLCLISIILNVALFIAQRLALGDKNSFSRFIIRIAIIATALSVSVMIIATCLVNGFTKEVAQKIFGFWGEIHIANFDNNESFEERPISALEPFVSEISKIKGVSSINAYASKTAILKTKKDIDGIVLKGLSASYDWLALKPYLRKGHFPKFNTRESSKQI